MPEKRLPIPKLDEQETLPPQPTLISPAPAVIPPEPPAVRRVHGPQFRELIRPFPPSLVHKAPQGKYGDYVSHSDINQAALRVVGPHSIRIVDVIRGVAAPVGNSPGRDNAIVGAVVELTVRLDGETVVTQEAGDVENPAMSNDGANLKLAVSDGYKRAWMRLGLGLHLWCDSYWLESQVEKDSR